MAEKKVLVIDDSIMIRKMVKSILAGKYEVLEANDGKSGLEVARRASPDLILLDFVMPKYNGYQTLQAIRRFDNLKDTPVIMISGLKEQVAEHVPEPFVGFEFLEKPFEAEVLMDRIQNLLLVSSGDATPAPPPPVKPAPVDGQQPDMQMLLNKMNATENLLIQGLENLIQREVVTRVGDLSVRVQKQEERLEKIVHQLEHQNKGLMVLLKEIKAIQARLGIGK